MIKVTDIKNQFSLTVRNHIGKVIGRLAAGLQVKPFIFIRRTNPVDLLHFIEKEHPQIIALILSHLKPKKAAIILDNLPDEIQEEITKRIAAMDKTSPEVIWKIEEVLRKNFSNIASAKYVTAGGIVFAVETLKYVKSTTKTKILKNFKGVKL